MMRFRSVHNLCRSVYQEMFRGRLFSLHWHPYAIEPGVDYSDEPPTLVEFRLEPRGDGTRLTVTESGFDRIPAHRRDEAFRMNDGGWTEQVQNIKRHVEWRAAAHGAVALVAARFQRRGGVRGPRRPHPPGAGRQARRSEEHTSELQSLMRISYAVFCLK